MANAEDRFQPAIDELEKELADVERHGNALRSAINLLRSKAGLPPLPDGSGGGGAPYHVSGEAPAATPQIKHDTFFGKRMGTAAREFLEMQKTAGNGPAKPREIFDALVKGGFQFDTKDDNTAVISVRNMLRKRTEVFQKLPNGTYGLKVWYPHPKTAKPSDESAEQTDQDTAPETELEDDSDDAAVA